MKDLKQALKENKAIIGAQRVLKNLKTGKLTNVYLASNCPNTIKDDVNHYAKLYNIKVNELKESNEELGTICKKPFSIAVLGY
ncbi:MAG: ribosomal L7Ae/L30e/S12e/Gadd45 family protein [Nanoarchaeota archaeon]